MDSMNRFGLIFLGFLFTMMLGSWTGRSDIVESCEDINTFEQAGITYNCMLRDAE